MPTFNQLVRKGREAATYKSTAPAMQKGLNTLLPLRRSRTPLCVRSPVCV